MANKPKKVEYSFGKGVWKTVKNSLILLVPFVIAILAGLSPEYAIITGPVIYFLKNLYETKKGIKLK